MSPTAPASSATDATPAISAPTMAPDANRVRRIAFVSLGCPKNLVDSEKMLGLLRNAGLELVSEHERADAIVVNTCGFLEASKDESLGVIKEAIERKAAGTLKRVVVAGCLVQRHRAKMLEWAPGIDAMIGVFDRDHIIDAVTGAPPKRETLASSAVTGGVTDGTPDGSSDGSSDGGATIAPYWISGNALQAAKERGLPTVGLTVNGADGRGIGYFEDDADRFRLTPRHWAYLRASEGCNQRCTFCTIPSIRGKMRSKPPAVIAEEARRLMEDGVFELNVIGQDTTSFGADIGWNASDEGLVGLLRLLDGVARDHGGGWVRLMYAYPSTFTDEMIDAIANLEHVVKYIDMPLQHASDRMLKAMRRNVTAQQQSDLVAKLRERIPGMAIRTTFITGFPGETEEDHQELMEFVDRVGFDMLGVFRYSREEGTPAGTMDLEPSLHVPEDVKLRREQELMLLQQSIAFENARYVAEQRCLFDVLIEGAAPGGTKGRATTGVGGAGRLHLGRAYFQAPSIDSVTYVHAENDLAPGELVRCTVIESDGYDLIARPTAELERRVSLPVMR